MARPRRDFLERDNAPYTSESHRQERPTLAAVSTASAPRRVEGERFRVVRSDGMPVVFLQGETLPEWAPDENLDGVEEPKPKRARSKRSSTVSAPAKATPRKPIAKRPAGETPSNA